MDKSFLLKLLTYVKINNPEEGEVVDYALSLPECPFDRENVIDLFQKTYFALYRNNILNEPTYEALKEKIFSQSNLFIDVIFKQVFDYIMTHPLKHTIREKISELEIEIEAFDDSIFEEDVPHPTLLELQEELNEFRRML